MQTIHTVQKAAWLLNVNYHKQSSTETSLHFQSVHDRPQGRAALNNHHGASVPPVGVILRNSSCSASMVTMPNANEWGSPLPGFHHVSPGILKSSPVELATLRRTWRAWMKLLLKNVIRTRTSLHKLTGKIKIRFNATNKISVVSFYPSSTHDEQFLHWDGRNNASVVPNMASTGQYGAIFKRKHSNLASWQDIATL